MGFCREMRLERTPEKGTGGSGEGRGERTLWAVRGSFEIRHLRRLSRGSADPREL